MKNYLFSSYWLLKSIIMILIILILNSCCSNLACACFDNEVITIVSERETTNSCRIKLYKMKIDLSLKIDSIFLISNSQYNEYKINNNTFGFNENIKDFSYLLVDSCKNKIDTIYNIQYLKNSFVCEEKCRGKVNFSCPQIKITNFSMKINSKNVYHQFYNPSKN